MTIYDLADVLNVKVLWSRAPGSGSCVCFLQDCMMMDKGAPTVVQGVGKTPYEAMSEYVNNIRGKRLVRHGATLGTSNEFLVPETLESIGR